MFNSKEHMPLRFPYRDQEVSVPMAKTISDLRNLAQDRVLPALVNTKRLSEGMVEVGVSAYRYMGEFEDFIKSDSFLELVNLIGQHSGKKANLNNPKIEHHALPNHHLSARRQNPNSQLEGGILGKFEEQTYLIGPIAVGKIPQREQMGPSFNDLSKATSLILRGTIAVDGGVLLTALDRRPKTVLNKHLIEIMEKVLPRDYFLQLLSQ